MKVFRNTTGKPLQPGTAVLWASSCAMTALPAPVVAVQDYAFWTWPTLQAATYDDLNLGWWFEEPERNRRVFLGKKDVLCCRDEEELRALIPRTPGVPLKPQKKQPPKPDPKVAVGAPPVRKIVLED